jgi:hypothetical protein
VFFVFVVGFVGFVSENNSIYFTFVYGILDIGSMEDQIRLLNINVGVLGHVDRYAYFLFSQIILICAVGKPLSSRL